MTKEKIRMPKAQASGREVDPALTGRTSGTLFEGEYGSKAESMARRKV
jgi:hypothetical protein